MADNGPIHDGAGYDGATYGPEVTFEAPAFIHPSALIHGKVRVRRRASLWPYVVIRAENYEVDIGESVNIQDFVMIHVGVESGTHVGAHCSVAHRAILHGCTLGPNTLVGIAATLMDGVEIGANCIIGAGALVLENTHVPDNSVVVGAPAKVIRTRNNFVANRFNAWIYALNAEAYRDGEHRRWDRDGFAAEAAEKMAALRAEFEALKDAGDPIAAEG
jgi:carbonic anhydrase/acetyltransferase-like protein (isoleucine patch superfamily)